jgi:hypothetical protein
MQLLISNLKHSWQSLKDCRKWIALAVVVDVLALICFGKAYIYVWTKAIENLNAVYAALGSEMADTAALAAQSAEMMSEYQALMRYTWMLLIAVVVIWVVSQGINWFLCSKIAMGKKIGFEYFGQHMLKFLMLSVFWTFVFLAITFLSVKLGTSSLVSVAPFNPALAVVLIAVMLYFELLSYGAIPKYSFAELIQKSFKIGVLHLKEFVPVFFFSVALAAVSLLIMAKLIAFNVTVSIGFFVIVLLPALSYIRILYVKTAEKIKA